MMLVDFINLPDEGEVWSNGDKYIHRNMFKNYKDLKIRISQDFPELYEEIQTKDIVKIISKDDDLAVILAMVNKLSWKGINLRVIIITQDADLLQPKVIGYYYDGYEKVENKKQTPTA